MEFNKYITADPNICHGKPTFRGTRVMVWQVLEMLARAEDDDILKAFPALTPQHIKAALAFATNVSRGERIVRFKTVRNEILSR